MFLNAISYYCTLQLSPKDVQALSVITYIGCALSLVAVCLTVLAIMLLP